MTRILKDYHPPGTLPGTLPARQGAGATRVWLTQFDGEHFRSEELQALDALARLPADGVAWIQVIGVGDSDKVRRVAEATGLHPLSVEDAVHRGQRPKIEDQNAHVFAVFQHPALAGEHIALTQISLFFHANVLVTMQTQGDDLLAGARERLEKSGGDMRTRGADFLFYALMDFIVDSAFPVLEAFGDRLEKLEGEIAGRPGRRDVMRQVHRVRHNLLLLRRALWPQRDIFAHLLRDGEQHFAAETRPYLRDLYDHAVQIIDVIETYRDIVTNLSDLYLSGLNLRLGDVMRTLTVISTLFMPLTFIAGVYGMNFDRERRWNMPELGWEYGYFFALGLMAAVAIGMFVFFRRKGWF